MRAGAWNSWHDLYCDPSHQFHTGNNAVDVPAEIMMMMAFQLELHLLYRAHYLIIISFRLTPLRRLESTIWLLNKLASNGYEWHRWTWLGLILLFIGYFYNELPLLCFFNVIMYRFVLLQIKLESNVTDKSDRDLYDSNPWPSDDKSPLDKTEVLCSQYAFQYHYFECCRPEWKKQANYNPNPTNFQGYVWVWTKVSFSFLLLLWS